MTRRSHMSRADEFKLGKFMEPLIKRLNDKTVAYVDGWSDEKVLQDCGVSGIDLAQIMRFRVAVFGKLSSSATGIAPMALAFTKIGNLEDRVAKLEARMSALEDAATRPMKPATNGPLFPPFRS